MHALFSRRFFQWPLAKSACVYKLLANDVQVFRVTEHDSAKIEAYHVATVTCKNALDFSHKRRARAV